MAVSTPLGNTFTRLPFPGSSTFTPLQTYSGMDQNLSDSWAKGVLKDLLCVHANREHNLRLTNLKIVFPKKDDIVIKTQEILKLYEASDTMTRDDMNPLIQTAFFDRLIFDDEKSYFEITDRFFQMLSASGQMRLYVENKKLIDYIIGITAMMKKQDALIEEFYTMSAACLRTGKTTFTNMLQTILEDIEKLRATPDVRIFINKINFLAINIDINLKQFNAIADKTSDDILDIITECFSQ